MNFFENLGYPEHVRINQCLDKIAADLARPRRHVGFLFGAGMSMAAGMVSGRELGKALLNLMFPPPGSLNPKVLGEVLDEFPLESIASAAAEYPGVKGERLTECLSDAFDPGKLGSTPNLEAHNLFARLVGLNYVSHIFTTNFDSLLEDAIGSRAKTVTQEDVHGEPIVGEILIYHLHGTIKSGNYKITESDLYRQRHQHALAAFRASLYQCNSFVFIGYSMADPDFKQVFIQNQSELRERGENEHRPSYVVMPFECVQKYTLAKAIWDTRRAHLIPMTAERFFEKLHENIASQQTGKMRTELCKRRGIGEALVDELIEQTKSILSVPSDVDALRFLLQASE